MRIRIVTALIAMLLAAPALADRLVFDHRLVPALKAVLDAGDPAMLSYNDSNPANVVDLIAVRGKSAQDWSEALVIIARLPDAKIQTTAQWLDQLKRDAAKRCPASFTVLAEDERSVTFERTSTGCPAGYPPVAIYRLVRGQKSLFLLAAMAKDSFTPETRRQWLALMASAHLE